MRGGRGQGGSAVLLMLLACLGVAIAVQSLAAIVICCDRALDDEAEGQCRQVEKEEALVLARGLVAESQTLTLANAEEAVPGGVTIQVDDIEGSLGWVTSVECSQDPSVSQIIVGAWVERGRDGVDLPLAALVASRVVVAPDRQAPWLEQDEIGAEGEETTRERACAYVRKMPDPSLVGEHCSVTQMAEAWRLDPGWAALASEEGGLDRGQGATFLVANRGKSARVGSGSRGCSPESPLLAVYVGGGDLDASGLGDFYGVLVVDDGSLLLEGTTLHGAAFASESIELGETGRVLYSASILRWATDGSLQRARLVPGSRSESMQ